MQYINKPATAEDVQDFINWLKTQTGIYDAQNTTHCPIARYLRDRGHTNVIFFGMYELHADGNKIDLPKIIGEIIYSKDGYGHVYSGALTRAQITLTEMIYSIKPSEDPGASLRHDMFPEPEYYEKTGIQDGTSTLTEGPAPDLPTDDTN